MVGKKISACWMTFYGVGLLLAGGCARVQPPDLPPNLVVAEQLREAFGGEKVVAAADTAATQTLPNPTGWGTLKGRIRLSENIPASEKPVDKDTHVCGTQAPNELVVCGPENGLKNVLVYLSTPLPGDSDPWVHSSYAESAKEDAVFDQKKCVFLSHVFVMRTTQKLKVLNSDNVGHNTNIPDFVYNSIVPSNSSDNSATVKATKRPAAVSCSIHPWMNAYIFASKTPYAVVTNAAGEFELKNVPAGVELEFTVWQEKIGYPKDATVNDKPEQWKQGKFVVRLENDAEKNLQIVFDAAKFR